MRNLAIWVSQPYCKDELFNPDSFLNRDDCLAAFRILKERIESSGGKCHTQDIFHKLGILPDIVLFLDIPLKPIKSVLNNWYDKVSKWVVLQECEVVLPHNWNAKSHNIFDKIFTWKTNIVNDKKYILLNFSNNLPTNINKDLTVKTKFCTIIAGNKKSNHPQELYSKRIEAIRWFELNHPDSFDLYGVGWDRHRFGGIKPLRALNRIEWLTKLLAPNFPSYRGKVHSKKDTLEKYKFAICYENAKDIEGYITEKIFDCFIAGIIPIYWGANNISDYIPKGCYINRNSFDSYDELYNYMINISDEEYLRYLNNIEEFLSSESSYPYTCDYFANTIVGVMKSET